jgi:hypothetical protein
LANCRTHNYFYLSGFSLLGCPWLKIIQFLIKQRNILIFKGAFICHMAMDTLIPLLMRDAYIDVILCNLHTKTFTNSPPRPLPAPNPPPPHPHPHPHPTSRLTFPRMVTRLFHSITLFPTKIQGKQRYMPKYKHTIYT